MSVVHQGRNLRPPEAAKHVGVSLATLRRYAKTIPGFPQPVRLSLRCTVFLESELDAWIETQAATRSGQGARA